MIAFHVESLTINFYNKLRVKFQKNVKWISFSCRSDVNSRATKKNWVFVLEDMNSLILHKITQLKQFYLLSEDLAQYDVGQVLHILILVANWNQLVVNLKHDG